MQTSTCRDETLKNQPNKTETTPQYFYTIPTSCAILLNLCIPSLLPSLSPSLPLSFPLFFPPSFPPSFSLVHSPTEAPLTLQARPSCPPQRHHFYIGVMGVSDWDFLRPPGMDPTDGEDSPGKRPSLDDFDGEIRSSVPGQFVIVWF